MENRFKMRISRMFRGSFGSCRTAITGDLSDVVEKPPVFIPQPQNQSYLRLTTDNPSINSPPPPPNKPRPNFSSICRPKFPQTTTDSIFPRQKISGHRFPPLHHDSQLSDPFYKKRNKKKSKKNQNQKKTFARKTNVFFSSFSSQDSAYFNGNYWFSSEDELDEETLFSSRSTTFSSDSSGSGRFRTNRRRKKKYSSDRRRKTGGEKNNVGPTVLPLDHHDGKVKDSFAVVKRSSDPYSDFRESMVEMIVEKQIFASYDLEKLLQCFLSLNSDHHHRIILEVFTEIYEALFS